MLESVILVLILIFSCYYIYNRKANPSKILKVYSQPGKWFRLKFGLIFLILWTRRVKWKLKRTSAAKLEKLKQLSEHEKAFDATFFQAVSKKGIYFSGGIERRHRAKANGLFYIALPELGLLESLKLPNTILDMDPVSILLMKEYGAEGIKFTQIKPMQKWRVSFDGMMRIQNDPNVILSVKLEGDWTSDLPFFLLDKDVSLTSVARAIAQETWNRQFFRALKYAHKSHYEQMGYFTGTLTVGDKLYKLEMDAFKDHSFGYKRDWGLLHRHVFHMLYLDDDTRVSYGVVSQPSTTSVLEMGYIVLPNKSLHSIRHSNFRLYQHGENGNPGRSYAFSFRANNETYDVSINVVYESTHYKGNNIEARIIERFVTCEVNGMKGRGISEWQYNNVLNREQIY